MADPTQAPAPAPAPAVLDAMRESIKAGVEVWPTYMMVLTSLTLGLAIPGNGWLLFRGLTRASLRDSPYHIILINQFLCTLLHCGVVWTGFTNRLGAGMGETSFVRVTSTMGLTLHIWFLTTAVTLQSYLAVNRALACCNPAWRISKLATCKKSTCVAMAVIWVVCFVGVLAIAVSETESYQGAFNCMIVDDYLENILAEKEMRPTQPAFRMVRNALTSFVSVDILVNAFAYVIIIWGLGAKQEAELSRTCMLMGLMLMEWMAFWIPHVVAFFYEQELLENYAYMYLPAMGMAVAPVIYVVALAEYRPPFLAGKANGIAVMPVDALKTVD